MFGGTWATNRENRVVFALGFEVEETDDAYAVVAILLSGERVMLDVFPAEEAANTRISELSNELRAITV